jgi:polysaccharide biosynthesis transport protein
MQSNARWRKLPRVKDKWRLEFHIESRFVVLTADSFAKRRTKDMPMDTTIIQAGGTQLEDRSPPQIERRGRSRVIEQSAERTISFGEVSYILHKRKHLIALITLALFSLALVYTLAQTPRYLATSIIEFNKENTDALALDDEQAMLGGANATDYIVTQQTQVKALQSDTLAFQVVQGLHLEQRPEFSQKPSVLNFFHEMSDESHLPLEKAPYRQAFVLKAYHKNLKVEAVPGTRMISVQFLNPDANVSALVVNTLVSDYKEQYFRTRYSATVLASDWLSKQLDDLKREVETSQQRFVDYQRQAGILGTDETHNIVMTRLEEIDKELTAAQGNRILTQTVWQLAKTGNPELLSGLLSPAISTGSTAMPNSLSLIEALRSQQDQLKMQYAEAASKYGSAYPKLTELQSQLREINVNIQTEVSNLAARAQNDYLTAKETQDALQAAFNEAKEEANKQNDSAVQYTILKHEADSSRDLYDSLSKKLKEAGVMDSLRSSNIVVLDPARPLDRPSRPFVLLNLAAGLFAGLFFGVAGAFLAENLDETISSPEQAEDISLVPSLGFIPQRKRWLGRKERAKNNRWLAPGTGVLVVAEPHSHAAEAYRSLRTAIIQSMRSDQCNVLLFTSALPDEGKTTISVNCAAALAQQGARVLLIEADMRRPRLSKELNLTNAAGLSSLIAGRPSSDKVKNRPRSSNLPLRLPGLPKLSVIPAGPRAMYTAELLGSPAMQALLILWRSEYDYIVIDTPPVLSVTDAVVLAPYCDGVVLVVRSQVTIKKSLERVVELFARTQTRIVGTVLNGMDVRGADYYRHFGHKYIAEGSDYYAPEED